MKTAAAMVIGAGINRHTIAFNLLRRGMKNVVLVEKSLIASVGTGESAAMSDGTTCATDWSNFSYARLGAFSLYERPARPMLSVVSRQIAVGFQIIHKTLGRRIETKRAIQARGGIAQMTQRR